jgi:phosphatidylglycerophosphate synthase
MRKVPSIKELRKYCKHEEGELWNLKIIRKISVYPLKLILYTPITANQLSLAWMILGLIAAFMLIPGNYWWALGGMILYQFAYLLDQLDGPVARFRKQCNLGGDYLDELTAYLHRGVLVVCMGIGAYMRFDNIIYLYAGIIASLFILLDQIMRLKPFQIFAVKEKIKELKKLSVNSARRSKSKLIEYILEFFRPQAFNIMLFAAIFDLLHVLILVYAVILPLMYFKTIILGYRYLRKII